MIGSEGDRDRGCARAREWCSQRLDGELSELERLLLRRHLGRCSDCRAFADRIVATTTALRSAPLEAPSRPLAPTPVSVGLRPRARRRLALAFALVALFAALGGVLGTKLADEERARPVTTIVELPPPPLTETAPTGDV